MPRVGEGLINESTREIKSFWKARQRGRKWKKRRNEHTDGKIERERVRGPNRVNVCVVTKAFCCH